MRVAGFGAGNFVYLADVNILLDGATVVWDSITSGQDDIALGVSISLSGPINAGQELSTFITLVDEQFEGTTTVDSYMSVVLVY
jgi:hypothetical protein